MQVAGHELGALNNGQAVDVGLHLFEAGGYFRVFTLAWGSLAEEGLFMTKKNLLDVEIK